jgi:hypothetical protein
MRPSSAQAQALGEVIDRWRIGAGWQPFDERTQHLTIAVWLELLNAAGVPPEAYAELYRRGLMARAVAIAAGVKVPDFGPELLLAVWPALKREQEQAAVAARKYLPAQAESVCPRCQGTGWEEMYREGRPAGRRPGCAHQSLSEAEQRERQGGVA